MVAAPFKEKVNATEARIKFIARMLSVCVPINLILSVRLQFLVAPGMFCIIIVGGSKFQR